MKSKFISSAPLPEHPIWERIAMGKRKPLSFYLELTARCNNNCTHCYINVPANDKNALKKELPFETLKEIIDEAASMGAIWCNLTGGEPLLRKDFSDIYLYLKKKGLLVSVFTNGTLITEEHIRLFKKYPPRDLEVTVYSITEGIYERVTRKTGSFKAFKKGLDLLHEHKVSVRLKAMAMQSNYMEIPEIAVFCRERTKDYFRFDPFLCLRFDRNAERNTDIKSERLSAEQIVLIEKKDPERFKALEKHCDRLIFQEYRHDNCSHIFKCGAGNKGFYISYDGVFRLCGSLCHSDCLYDLSHGNIKDAWENFIPKIRTITSMKGKYLQTCGRCPIINLCMWCPAHVDLETGHLDESVEYFCEIAHKRSEMLEK